MDFNLDCWETYYGICKIEKGLLFCDKYFILDVNYGLYIYIYIPVNFGGRGQSYVWDYSKTEGLTPLVWSISAMVTWFLGKMLQTSSPHCQIYKIQINF
jgi:hypothetical protein